MVTQVVVGSSSSGSGSDSGSGSGSGSGSNRSSSSGGMCMSHTYGWPYSPKHQAISHNLKCLGSFLGS